MCVADVFEARVLKQGAAPFLLYEDITWSFGTVDLLASKVKVAAILLVFVSMFVYVCVYAICLTHSHI